MQFKNENRVRDCIYQSENLIQQKVLKEVPYFYALCRRSVAQLIKLQEPLPKNDHIVNVKSSLAAWNELDSCFWKLLNIRGAKPFLGDFGEDHSMRLLFAVSAKTCGALNRIYGAVGSVHVAASDRGWAILKAVTRVGGIGTASSSVSPLAVAHEAEGAAGVGPIETHDVRVPAVGKNKVGSDSGEDQYISSGGPRTMLPSPELTNFTEDSSGESKTIGKQSKMSWVKGATASGSVASVAEAFAAASLVMDQSTNMKDEKLLKFTAASTEQFDTFCISGPDVQWGLKAVDLVLGDGVDDFGKQAAKTSSAEEGADKQLDTKEPKRWAFDDALTRVFRLALEFMMDHLQRHVQKQLAAYTKIRKRQGSA